MEPAKMVFILEKVLHSAPCELTAQEHKVIQNRLGTSGSLCSSRGEVSVSMKLPRKKIMELEKTAIIFSCPDTIGLHCIRLRKLLHWLLQLYSCPDDCDNETKGNFPNIDCSGIRPKTSFLPSCRPHTQKRNIRITY